MLLGVSTNSLSA